MFSPKRSGQRLTEPEFRRLERFYKPWVGPKRKHIYVDNSIEAVAHIALAPFSIFGLGTLISSKPIPRLNTVDLDDASPFLIATNGNIAVAQGEPFHSTFLNATRPLRVRVSDDVVPNIPIGISETALEADVDFSSNLIAVSESFTAMGETVAWVVLQNSSLSMLGTLTTAVDAYDAVSKRLGTGTIEFDIPHPYTDIDPWTETVWNSHNCEIASGVRVKVDAVHRVGLCLSHPDFEDQTCS